MHDSTPSAAPAHRSVSDPPTFADWWEEFTAMSVNVRPSTLRRDKSIFSSHLGPAFGRSPLDRIDYRSARRFVAELAATDLAPRTVRKADGLLTQSLDVAVRAGVLDRNPANKLALPQVPHKDPRFLAAEEVELVASTIDPRYRTFVLVGAYAGLRHGELAALRAGQVDPEASTIEVVETRTIGRDGTPEFGPPKSLAGCGPCPCLGL